MGPQTYTCEQCGEGFTREKLHSGKTPRFCSAQCGGAWRHRQRPYGEWRVAGPKLRPYTCQDCGTGAVAPARGPLPTRCSDCALNRSRIRAAEWQRKHKQRATAHKKAWAEANPDKVKACLERSAPQNRERERQYRVENRDRVLAWNRDRQARRRARQIASETRSIKAIDIFERDNWLCGICQVSVDARLSWPDGGSPSLDHVVPLSRGGSHTSDNVQLAHLSCNIRKGSKLM